MAVRITCIKKDGGNHENPYVAISSLNWIDDAGGPQKTSTREQMHDWVAGGGHAYVQSGGSKARLIAQVSPRGTKYVKTEADKTLNDNLLKLPECA
jgi:hypothetical protein